MDMPLQMKTSFNSTLGKNLDDIEVPMIEEVQTPLNTDNVCIQIKQRERTKSAAKPLNSGIQKAFVRKSSGASRKQGSPMASSTKLNKGWQNSNSKL